MKRPVPLAATALAAKLKGGPDGFVRLRIDERDWISLAMGCAQGLQDLLALWVDGDAAHMGLSDSELKLRIIVSVPLHRGSFPSVAKNHAAAIRLERTLQDLHGVKPLGLPDGRNWIDHGKWPSPPPNLKKGAARPDTAYTFMAAEGEGLHQIAVGPVHAGIIEPGHFRFTASGEAVVRLEERLGYAHKGIEALCRGADIATAARIAARISGDSTVAYSYAYALAIEAALKWRPAPRAVILRGIMAELERLSHHVNDVGAICNDASVVVLHAHCTLLREDILKTANQCFGHRMMMDRIVPGGVAADLSAEGADAIEALLRRCTTGFEAVVRVYDEAPSLQDRTVSTGIVSPELVQRFGAGGHVGRASGRAFDTRQSFPYPPYRELDFTMALHSEGDVDARVWIRIEEVRSSIALIRQMLKLLAPGPLMSPMPKARAGEGAAMVESFRGDVFIALRLDDRAQLANFHARDPSCFQWPLLEAAIEGNIVADFPLCNKSFNCSYSGHDM
ncbi:MAG: NADH-quinone oxidoreductase subunit C [Alphaproteobacteria bacterium]|nr:NADH-quinone oxidoreductase subunit C [Alphaproteobacteria bacterium]